jgi:hypothetical protein
MNLEYEQYQELLKIEQDVSKLNERQIWERMLYHLRHLDRYTRLQIITSATLKFKGDKDMPATIQVGGTATATYLEWSGPSGTGIQVPPTGTVTYASDTPSVATVDPNSGICTGVGAGTANISGVDSGTSLSASDVLTVTAPPPPPAVSATLNLVANSSAKPQASRRA